jgi:hypothetical protein
MCLDYISIHINELSVLIRNRNRLIRHLQRLVSNGLYICGHSDPSRDNIEGRRRHILTIQVSNRYRLRNTHIQLEGRCRLIAAIYIACMNTDNQRTLLLNLNNTDRWLLFTNSNYISEYLPLYNQLFNLDLARSRVYTVPSMDTNSFILIEVYEDGYLHYRY